MTVTNICGKENCHVYDEELNLDGTLGELIDRAYRYDKDYSDEALMEIARLAREYGLPEEKCRIPELVVKARARKKANDGTLPYEAIKLDKLVYGKISFSQTMPYGEVKIYENHQQYPNLESAEEILVTVSGSNDTGEFVAIKHCALDTFMQGNDDFLELTVDEALVYGKHYVHHIELPSLETMRYMYERRETD